MIALTNLPKMRQNKNVPLPFFTDKKLVSAMTQIENKVFYTYLEVMIYGSPLVTIIINWINIVVSWNFECIEKHYGNYSKKLFA